MLDWLLVVVIGALVVVEIFNTYQFDNAYIATLVALLFVATLPWRRSHSLAVLLWGIVVAGLLYTMAGDEFELASVGVALAISTYALIRWPSGMHIVIGTGAILLFIAGDLVNQSNSSNLPGTDATSRVLFWLIFIVLGIAMRYRSNSMVHRIRAVQLEEREALARELHDTVAHHVSAIAIQAQAARVVGSGISEDVLNILENIEKSASLGLSEMRKVLGVLRASNEDPLLSPQISKKDFERLADSNGAGPRIELELADGIDDLSPSSIAALYRITQESISNARRHGIGVTRIVVALEISNERVRLTVTDDGEPASPAAESTSGLGLVGMAERAKLLGGDFEAGPGSDWGWFVKADLPKGTSHQ